MSTGHRVTWRMRDELTGEERSGEYLGSEQEATHFWWTEGNWSCDYNRAVDFYGATENASPPLPQDAPERGVHECLVGPSRTQRFTLLVLTCDGTSLL